MSESSAEILREVRRVVGFIPPYLQAAAGDAEVLQNLWIQSRSGYMLNGLPASFKERLLAVVGRWNLTSYCTIVRSCALAGLGMAPKAISELLRAKLPRQSLIVERVRLEATNWPYKSSWATMPRELESWILWAAIRVTLRKDPAGRCRNILRDVLGDQPFNSIILLGSFAVMQRLWVDAHPELDPSEDARVQANRDKLLQEAPEIAKVWARLQRRGTSSATPRRHRKLLAEIARQDRIRQALRDSERRFRRVVQSVPFPVMLYAEDGHVVMLNRAWTELSGWGHRDIPTVQAWLKKAEQSDEPWEASDVKALYGWNEVVEEGEQKILTASGQDRKWDFYTASVGRLTDGRHAIMRVAVDVTERNRLEGALWETNRRVVSILEAITDGFLALDHEGRFLYANRRAESILKVNGDELIGKTYREVFKAHELRLHEAASRCLKERTTEHVEWYSDTAGAYLEMHLYASEEGLSAYFRDIGQRKLMERRLRASERRFRGFFESDMLGIFFADRFSGAIMDCNDAFLSIIGYTRDDLNARQLNWVAMTPPEYAEVDAEATVIVGKQALVPYQKEFIHKDGHRIPVLIGGAPFAKDDNAVMAFVIDRSAQQEAERRSDQMRQLLDAIVRASPTPIIILDMQGSVTLWNQAAEDAFGYTEQEVLGKPYPLAAPEGRSTYAERFRRVGAGESLYDVDVLCVTKDRGRVTMKASCVPVRAGDGRVIALMGMLFPKVHPNTQGLDGVFEI